MDCPNGHEVRDGHRFCAVCGAVPIEEPAGPAVPDAKAPSTPVVEDGTTTSSGPRFPKWVTPVLAGIISVCLVAALALTLGNGSDDDDPRTLTFAELAESEDERSDKADRIEGEVTTSQVPDDVTSTTTATTSAEGDLLVAPSSIDRSTSPPPPNPTPAPVLPPPTAAPPAVPPPPSPASLTGDLVFGTHARSCPSVSCGTVGPTIAAWTSVTVLCEISAEGVVPNSLVAFTYPEMPSPGTWWIKINWAGETPYVEPYQSQVMGVGLLGGFDTSIPNCES